MSPLRLLSPVLLALALCAAPASAQTFSDGQRGEIETIVKSIITIARDSSIDTIIGALPICLVGGAIFYGIGRFVQVKVNKKASAQVTEQQPAPDAVAA